jgi:hypothetical protein
MSISLKKFHVLKESMGYVVKKREKRENIHAKRAWERKKSIPKSMHNPMLKSMKKRKKREKDSPYFQIEGSHQKERESHDQRSTKIFRIRKIFKIPHMQNLDQSV